MPNSTDPEEQTCSRIPVPDPNSIRVRNTQEQDGFPEGVGEVPVRCPRPADLHYREFGQWWHVTRDGRVVDCDDAD